ncbi:hypothetical protein C2G38_2281485 [Gigaspora rosea]|uniref:Uncharacterized protein n=1 Tax=Gigaspora rosea TaxID=44941 RepID=A0A397U4U6_9GLOM|nr:hypothetical protein C2G38_2281485 [Gigaspora rosea]
MEYCTKCQCNHPINQFIWEGKHHKTCIKSKKKLEQANNMLPNIIAYSLDNYELNFQDRFEIPSEESFVQDMVTDELPETDTIKVDYLDLGALIEHEIQELTIGAQIDRVDDGVADVAYQTHLVVSMDNAMTQDKTAKEIANLIIAEIEGGDDYS